MSGMASTIYKYQLQDPWESRVTDLQIPEGAAVLKVAMQHQHLCLWAVVDPEEKPVERRFVVYGTGQTIETPRPEEHLSYKGTALTDGGLFVWHVFELVGRPSDRVLAAMRRAALETL